MDIISFGVANFKSFDEKGVSLEKFGKINILIGKNNSGKSNFLRFLKLFSENFDTPGQFPKDDLENQFKRNGKSPELIIKIKRDRLSDHPGVISQLEKFTELSYRIDLMNRTIEWDDHLKNLNDIAIHKLQDRYEEGSSRNSLMDAAKQNIVNKIYKELNIFKNLIYIPDIRKISENPEDVSKSNLLNGDNIISRLFEMQNPMLVS